MSQGITPTLAAGWPRYDDVIGAAAENGYRIGYVTASLANEQDWLDGETSPAAIALV